MVSEAKDLSKDNFDAKQFLKKHINETNPGGIPSTPPPTYVENPQDMIPQQVIPQQVLQQQPAYVQPVQAHITLPPNIEERLNSIEENVQKLTEQLSKFNNLEDKVSKFIQRGLDGRVKQITLRLDDPKNKK